MESVDGISVNGTSEWNQRNERTSISLLILSSEMVSVVANAVHSKLIIDFLMPSMS